MPFLVVLIGVFAVAEAFVIAEGGDATKTVQTAQGPARIGGPLLRSLIPTFVRGSIVGTLVGALLGAGANIASWLAYDQERRWSKNPGEFGKGSIAGVTAPGAAGSASVGGALIPLLTLGIPGSPTTAVLVGALVLHGLQPRPQLFTEHPDLVYGLFVGLAGSFIHRLSPMPQRGATRSTSS